jgi:hypothetical protein
LIVRGSDLRLAAIVKQFGSRDEARLRRSKKEHGARDAEVEPITTMEACGLSRVSAFFTVNAVSRTLVAKVWS